MVISTTLVQKEKFETNLTDYDKLHRAHSYVTYIRTWIQ